MGIIYYFLMSDIEEDFLEIDRHIPGQNFVCLSFLSPDKILEDKKLYRLYKFNQNGKDEKISFNAFKEQFIDFTELNEVEINDEFNKICDYKTNVRGLKVRGVYDTEREANIRAKVLQKLDNSFHVYVGQVGYWLPWDPNPNNIENQEYLNKDLNRLNNEYNKNQIKRDIFYEEQKRDKKKAAMKENEERKRKNKEVEDQKKKKKKKKKKKSGEKKKKKKKKKS